MKARILHQFFTFAAQFSLESMINEISRCSFDLFNEQFKTSDNLPNYRFASVKRFTYVDDKINYTGKVTLVQTFLIDMMYDIVCLKRTGEKIITENGFFYLALLYADYSDQKYIGFRDSKKDIQINSGLRIFAALGEQRRFQELKIFLEEFSREKYILEKFSTLEKTCEATKSIINLAEEFLDETGFTIDNYSALLLSIMCLYINSKYVVQSNAKLSDLPQPLFSIQNIVSVLERYAIEIEEIRESELRRQVFYTKPIIKIGNSFYSSNPYLIIAMFTNSIYWVMRNRHYNIKSQKFLNAFGRYFESYVEELLVNCLDKDMFEKIPESNIKQADWYLHIEQFEFLIEQKSGLSGLGVKQTYPDLDQMKNHIIKNWGEAVVQLASSQQSKKLKNPIKIILVYEDYFKSECLDELFMLNENLDNDNKYWILTIREFEMLLQTYKNNPKLFEKIIKEKDSAELINSKKGRDLLQFLNSNGIVANDYLYSLGIKDSIERLVEMCK